MKKVVINIRGKQYELQLKARRLINVINPRDIRIIDTEALDHFRSIAAIYQ